MPINTAYETVRPKFAEWLEPRSEKTAAGSQRPMELVMQKNTVKIMMLYRPNLSARYPEAQRPIDDDPL